MSSDFTSVIKEGHVKVKGKHLGLWKSHWLQLHNASSQGPVRLERYSSREAAHQSVDEVNKPVYLTKIQGMRRIATDGRKQAIEIFFSTSDVPSFTFCPDNDAEADSWYKMLEQVRNMLMSEDSSSQQSMFHVYLLPTPNLSAHGECLLQVTTQDVSLYDGSEQCRVLARWPLPALRRFGREGAKFTIESGRSSPTGEGIFVFSSWQNELIYQTMHRASTTIAESVRIARTTSERLPSDPMIVPPVNLSPAAVPIAPRSPGCRQRGLSLDSGRPLIEAGATGTLLDSGARGPLPPVPGK